MPRLYDGRPSRHATTQHVGRSSDSRVNRETGLLTWTVLTPTESDPGNGRLECSRKILGYSGGAVPDLHRSSLFVGRTHRPRPTTNARSPRVKPIQGWPPCKALPTDCGEEEKTPGRLCRRPGVEMLSVLLPDQSRNPDSSWLRLGCCNLRTALASIWRIRSRVTLNMWPTSSSV